MPPTIKPTIPIARWAGDAERTHKGVADAFDKVRERFSSLDSRIDSLVSASSTEQQYQQLQALMAEVARLRTAVNALAITSGSSSTSGLGDGLFLLAPTPEPAVRDDSARLLWPSEPAAPPAINEASAILAARVFSGA